RRPRRPAEFAVPAALGAGRARMIRHLLTESLLLTAVGGALGMIVAEVGVRMFVAVAPAALPRANAIEVDGAALTFGLVITMVVGVAVGVIPAFRTSTTRLRSSLQFGSTRITGGHHKVRPGR